MQALNLPGVKKPDVRRDTIRRELRENRQRARLAQQRIQAQRYERTARLLEGSPDVNWVASYADMIDRFTNRELGAFNISTINDRRFGRNFPIFQNEQELALLRMPSRILCSTNAYAIGLLEGLTSYVLGKGFQYRVVARKGATPPQSLLDFLQDVVDDFHARNEWFGGEQPGLEEELFWRSCEDGEFLVRHFRDPCDASRTVVRTVEPEQLSFTGSGWRWDEGSFGILTDGFDTQKPLAYWIFYGFDPTAGEAVEPSKVTHFRKNVKRTIKRGMPDFCFDTRDALELSSKLRRNMGTGAAIQAAIVGIREHSQTTKGDVGNFLDDQADYDIVNQVSGRTEGFRKYDAGTWEDIPENMKYVPPPSAANAHYHVEILQACLRGAGVRWNAPEWLGSADASNNNFASSLTAESPFVKTSERKQQAYKQSFVRLVWCALENYCTARGYIEVPIRDEDAGTIRVLRLTWQQIKQVIDVQCEPPQVQSRDPLQETQRNQILHQEGVLSKQTWSQKESLDYDDEQTNRQEDQERFGDGIGLTVPAGFGQEEEGGGPPKPSMPATQQQQQQQRKQIEPLKPQ